jgi:alkylation response protein AidB-like acyl-CoA dehydrogenase
MKEMQMQQPAADQLVHGAGVASRPSLSEKARAMTSLFAAHAAANEAKGSLTDAALAGLRDGGFLGMWIPRCFGGAEAGPVESLEVIEALCYADGSTGWVLMAAQVAMGSAAAYLDRSAANQIFGGGMPIIAGQGAPNGRADAEGNGYRLTGKWFYGSGLLHAEYVHTGGVVHENGKPRMYPGTNTPDVRIFIVPVKQAKFLGNWDVLGLKATASVDYAITDVFVPEEFTHRQSAATPNQGGSLYRLGISGIGAICHTGFALGTGRRMLDELAALARAGSGRPQLLPQLGGGESFQEQFGLAEAKLRASRAFAFEVWNELQAVLERGDEIGTRNGTLYRLALNYATSTITEVCSFAYKYGGGVALRDGVLQRCFRDMHAGTQHVTSSPPVRQACGRQLAGLAPDARWQFLALADPA